MSMIALQGPDFSRTSSRGIQVHRNSSRISSSWIMVRWKPTSGMQLQEKEKLEKLSVPKTEKNSYSPSDIRFDRSQQKEEFVSVPGDRLEFGLYVARQAQLDEEYWTAAWLRAESHWEDKENDRYVDNYKRKFAEQEFNGLKLRCKAQLGDKCTCIVAVKKEDKNVKRTVLKSIVGTLDLTIRYLSQNETFPGEQVKAPLFCLIGNKASSKYGYISNLCVAKYARRQGIAINMLQFAIDSAKAHGAEKVYVHVHRHNTPAQGLYQRLGFEIVDAASSQLVADQTYLLCLRANSNYKSLSFSL